MGLHLTMCSIWLSPMLRRFSGSIRKQRYLLIAFYLQSPLLCIRLFKVMGIMHVVSACEVGAISITFLKLILSISSVVLAVITVNYLYKLGCTG